MAVSTGVVLTAGALTLTDKVIDGWDPAQALKITAATVIAAYVSAGLDKLIPNLGTGLAALLLMGALFQSGPRLAKKLFP